MSMMKASLFCLAVLVITFGCTANKSSSSGKDSAKENVVKAEKLSISKALQNNSHLPIEERVALYLRLKSESPDTYNFENEDELTMYGYSFLWDSNVTEAIEIFKLIVNEFPNSSNPYDNLGEGYLANGDMDLSLVNYEKSLELDPNNFNAEDQIERIRFPDRKPETPLERFGKIYPSQEYIDDLDQLGKRLIKVHPGVFKFTSEKDFWGVIDEKKSLITDQTSYSEFVWLCSEIIASINCSHTSLGRFSQESEMLPMSLRFPIQIRWVNNQLFVLDSYNNSDRVKIRDEILSINGMLVSDLVAEIFKHIASQGYIKTTKKHFFNTWATAMIPYALGFPVKYEILVKGEPGPIVLNPAESFRNLFQDISVGTCPNDLCFDLVDGKNIALLTIRSFNYYPWGNLKEFTDFIDSSFREIDGNEVDNLIVDVRFNGGGSPESSIYLLKYLSGRPFTYYSDSDYGAKEGKETQYPFENAFKGERYYLIDGNGNSTTGHFMSMVKALDLGTIVGEELGSNQFCSAGQKTCRLSNTKLEYYVANSTHETTATSLPDEIGILPDHYVTQSIEEYIDRVDAVMDYTLELIEK